MNIFDVLKTKLEESPHQVTINFKRVGKAKYIAVDDVIKLINQVEQKFENDFCEWKHMPVTEGLFVSHGEPEKLMNVESWDFCPYCGKKIKIIY